MAEKEREEKEKEKERRRDIQKHGSEIVIFKLN